MNERQDRQRRLFAEALEIADRQARAAFLAQSCVGDQALLREVEDLLQAESAAGEFLPEKPGTRGLSKALGEAVQAAVLGGAGSNAGQSDKDGEWIGRYKLLQKIGEGGAGVVYMAEQQEPVRRKVALKVIKLGMDTKQVIARFEAERQALALMDHPNISKVLDGGATATGSPYFVMEMVRGIKITDYCDQHHLSTRERLELFIQICQAIQHAHQKGIIHRDIKPSNILVTLHDGVPVPKVIDFGIAKATCGQRLTDKTLFTAFEQFIGTPTYMSPEQAEMSGLDVDTRSDIYSLGVLLYELLTGQTPFEAKELLAAGLDAMRRTIREQEPPKPSTRLSSMGIADTADVTNCFRMSPTKLAALVRGDLDWIVMKALEKDRARRYESANGLAMDIQRHLGNEPVVARPPSATYRFQKLVRRNKIAVTAASAVAVALNIGLGVSISFFLKEKAEAAKSQQVAKFLKDMLSGVHPSTSGGRDTQILMEILDKTSERVGKDLKNQPEVEAELKNTIGSVYRGLGLHQKAETMLRDALGIRRKLWGSEHLEVAASLFSLAAVLYDQQKLTEAETLEREALALREKFLGHKHRDVAFSLNNLGIVLGEQGKLAEAERVHRQALAIRKALADKDEHSEARAELAQTLINLAVVLENQGKVAEAQTMRRDALELYKKRGGSESGEVALALLGLAEGLRMQGKLADAETMYRDADRMNERFLNGDQAADSHNDLALLLSLQETKTVAREVGDDYEKFSARSRLGRNLLAQKKYTEAEPLLVSGYEGMKQREDKIPARNKFIHLTGALQPLVKLYEATSRPDQAAKCKSELTQWYRKAADSGDVQALNGLAWLLATSIDSATRDGPMAITFAEKAVAATKRKDPAILDTLAAAYAEAGEFAKAVTVQNEALALLPNEGTKKDFNSRLKLYESNQPYREP